MEKWIEYAAKITSALGEVLTDELSENYINPEELNEDDNATHFIHALANVAPHSIYQEITGDKSNDNLGFNHIANRLCVQYKMDKVK